MIHRPLLTDDAEHNRRVLQEALHSGQDGELELPPGTHEIADGLTVPGRWTVRGAETVAAGGGPPGTWLVSRGTGGRPVLHIVGSDVAVRDLGLRPPPADPGEHGGDRGTAITVGEYLYAADPEWIGRVDIRRVQVQRLGDRAANSIALMGAVCDVTVRDVTVHGGHTGVAVHWGAVGADVHTIVGATYHPHRLRIEDLRVRDAVEGFYLSSVHDVQVIGGCLRDVEMGFRLLPGDNTDRFHPAGADDDPAPIGARIEIADVCVRWTGDRYGVRVAGWGRSEVDGAISVLRYTDTVIRDCVLQRAGPAPSTGSWAPIVMERAAGVALQDIRLGTPMSDRSASCCGLG